MEIPEESDDLERLRQKLATYELGFPPGHFYSPIPSLTEVRAREDVIFAPPPATLPEIDLNVDGQMALLRNLSQFYEGQPFSSQPSINRRYHFENDNFRYGEALILYSMLRHLRPKRLVEIGSGYSSAVSLDTNDLFLDGSVKCLFIDPFPQLLLDLIESHPVKGHLKIVADEVQNTDDTYFSELEENDVVFIDSTHVSKIGSDVNYLIFCILPLLRKGVYIHFHDVYYPFEYPSDWIYQGRAWNEAYLLRAFLQCNASYRIAIFNSYLAHHHLEVLLSQMPLCQYGVGSSLWLVKVS